MAGFKKQRRNHPEKTQNGNLSIGSSLLFDLSATLDSSLSANAINKPLHNLCNSPAFQRVTPFKYLYSSPLGSMVAAGNTLKGKVWKLCSIFEAPKTSPNSQPPSSPKSKSPKKHVLPAPEPEPEPEPFISIPKTIPDSPFRLPGTEDRVVIYFTSLRGIRKTFHDCHSIRMIFRGFRVNVDERDISMDAGYRKELQRVLGEISLPQVFIKGKYIGGADVIRQLLECGELVMLIKGLPLSPSKPCEACDDVRFIPCMNCDGSRKVYDEDEEQPKRCTECNENGLIRCPLCCL